MRSARHKGTIIFLISSPIFPLPFFLPHVIVIAAVCRAFTSFLLIRLRSLVLYAIKARPRLRICSLILADGRAEWLPLDGRLLDD